MKKIITILLLVSISLLGKSQENDTIPDLLPYEDAAAGLFISKVVEVKDKSQKDLITQFKNWASTRFVNLKEVIVSETDNQIVLNYAVDQVYSEAIGYYKYIEDASTMYTPMDPPIMSSNNDKQLVLKPWF